MKVLLKNYGWGVMWLSLANIGWGADLNPLNLVGDNSPVSSVNVEVKPIPTLLSAAPGQGAFGISTEGFVSDKVSIYLELGMIDSSFASFVDKEDRREGKLYLDKLRGSSVDLGVRRYGWLFGDSWYSGLKVGYSTAKADYLLDDESIDHRIETLTPGVEAGYRWLWPSNFLVRLGGGVSANSVQSLRVSSDVSSDEIEEEKKDIREASRTPVLAKLDFGVGYQF